MTDIKKKQYRKQFFTSYSLDTPELSYLERNFPEKQVQLNCNRVKAGHGLAATVRDLSENIWFDTHNHYRVLDIGGSLTRNGGQNGFPTYNIVLSQKDLVRGLREENLHHEYIQDLKNYVKFEAKLQELEIKVEALNIDDWSEEPITDEDTPELDLTTLEQDELTIEEHTQIARLAHKYGSKLAKYKKIYRQRHYQQLAGRFEWLLFNHSVYDITPEQVFDYMFHFGANKATAFINVWDENKPIYANTITCEIMTDLHTGEKVFAQKDSVYTSFYAHKQDPRTYAVPGKFTKGRKCLSWEVRVVRDDLIEIEFSLTRAFGKPGLIQESEAIALKKEYYQLTYQDPRTGQTQIYNSNYRAPPYFQNRVDTLMIRQFAGKNPNKSTIFDTAQKIVADENRKILLTENNKTLSVNMSKEQMLDVTVHTAVEFARYMRMVRSAGHQESKIKMWIYWLLTFLITEHYMNVLSTAIHWYFYAILDHVKRTEYYNVELHTKYDTIINKEHNDQTAIGTSYQIEDDLDSWYNTYLGWATLDGFSYGKLLSNSPTRQELIGKLKETYKNTTGCLMGYYPAVLEAQEIVKATTCTFGDLTIEITGLTTKYMVYAAAKLNKKLKKAQREHRVKNETIDIVAMRAEIPKFEPIYVMKPPVQFENVSQFSITNTKYNTDDCIEYNFGTSSTKTKNQDTQDWLKNLSARNDLKNNESSQIKGAAIRLFDNLRRPQFEFATPHEYYQRWINTKPKSEEETLIRELDEFQNSLTDANIFLKLEHLFKKFNDPQFVKAHTVTHFDKVCNSILTMFAEDFKVQLDKILRKHNIVYTDGTPTFELEHLQPREDEMYFESDLTAQDAKQGSHTVAEFIKFYDLVGAPEELTTCLFATYNHTARNSKTKTKISNGTLKPTGGPDTGIDNLLNNLFLSQDLLFSPAHVYSQLLGDDLKSIIKKWFDLQEFLAKVNTMGTEMKPETREYPEFCSNVTYHNNGVAKLVPKTEKIYNTMMGAEMSYQRGLTTAEKLASTMLNFATMYGHLENCKRAVRELKYKGYTNQEYNQASVPLFKSDQDVIYAMEALSKHSVYTEDVEYQIGLLGQIEDNILRICDEHL